MVLCSTDLLFISLSSLYNESIVFISCLTSFAQDPPPLTSLTALSLFFSPLLAHPLCLTILLDLSPFAIQATFCQSFLNPPSQGRPWLCHPRAIVGIWGGGRWRKTQVQRRWEGRREKAHIHKHTIPKALLGIGEGQEISLPWNT